jgi:tetratricopeptide (TPR) repeat protein
MFTREDELQIRRFLLGQLREEERERFEERILDDQALLDHLSIVEEELIDDYLFGTLAGGEEEDFEQRFLTTPKRREKLVVARRLKQFADRSPVVGNVKTANGMAERIRRLFFPAWKSAIFALIVAGIGFEVWRSYLSQSQDDEALIALNQAYRVERPVESRITGLDYAPYTVRRGTEDEKTDSLQRDRADILSRTSVSENPTAKAYQMRARFYLAGREYDKAIEQFEVAVTLAPNDAQIHSDYGAVYSERLSEYSDGQQAERKEAIDRALYYLDKALKLDPSLPEALFNRALLNERMGRRAEAHHDWEGYLQLDPDSFWSKDAQQHLDRLR